MQGEYLWHMPVIFDSDDMSKRAQYGDDIIIGGIKSWNVRYPESFQLNHYCMVFVTRGMLRIQVNFREYVVEAPSISILFIGHVLRLIEHSPDCEVRLLAISKQFVDDMLSGLDYSLRIRLYNDPVVHLTHDGIAISERYLGLMEEIVGCRQLSVSRVTLRLLARSLVKLLIDNYQNEHQFNPLPSRSAEVALHYMSLIAEHCKEHHSIDWYAEEMCLSSKYISNVVKQITGKSAGAWIDYHLLLYAKAMLLDNAVSVLQIAEQLGFQNQSHFGTWFKRQTGQSPRQWRKLR